MKEKEKGVILGLFYEPPQEEDDNQKTLPPTQKDQDKKETVGQYSIHRRAVSKKIKK